MSENFVRLNMKVKRYSKRPGRALTGSAYKRQEWKKRQKGEEGKSKGVGRFVCFKCGKTGHWARNCQDRGGSTNLGSFSGQRVDFSESVGMGMEDEVDDITLETLEKECPFPSVSQAARMATGTCRMEADDPDDAVYIPPPPNHSPPPSRPAVEPLYLTEDGRVPGIYAPMTNTPMTNKGNLNSEASGWTMDRSPKKLSQGNSIAQTAKGQKKVNYWP